VEHGLIELDTAVRQDEDGTLCPPDVGPAGICFTTIDRDEVDVLPGVSLVYTPRTDMNFRFAWGQTISRPEFRELAPTQFPAARGERSQFGNISLVQSMWTGVDVRWEWLFSESELISLGGFWKKGEDPIEKTEIPQGSGAAETWINGETAKVLGFEFEGRKNLGFAGKYVRGAVGRHLQNVDIQTNATIFPVKETTVPSAVVAGLETLQTNTERDTIDVPDYIVNAAVEYTLPDVFTARLLYQRVGETLTRAGSTGLPDAFVQPFDQLDFILQVPLERWTGQPLTFGVGVENITNDQIIEMQGDFVTRRYTRGVTVGMSITYAP
jgi:outer membrane receptor protein involved in Fe transport